MQQIGNNSGGINGWITRKAFTALWPRWSSCREIAIELADQRSKREMAW